MDGRFPHIYKDILFDLLFTNSNPDVVWVEQKQILYNLHKWILYKYTGSVPIEDFDEVALEIQCKFIAANIGVGSKMGSDKGHDKPLIFDGDIFKLVIFLKKLYERIGLKNNSNGLSLTWMEVLENISSDIGGQPIEGLSFLEDQ